MNPDLVTMIVTGRNEVLAKVIFSQACVILSTGGCLVPGGFLQIFGGGVSGPGGVPPNFRGGRCLHRNTVNVRPVRILLECILVEICIDNILVAKSPGHLGGWICRVGSRIGT